MRKKVDWAIFTALVATTVLALLWFFLIHPARVQEHCDELVQAYYLGKQGSIPPTDYYRTSPMYRDCQSENGL
jgi:hypothetical protein